MDEEISVKSGAESRPVRRGYVTAEDRGGRGPANFSGSRKQRARISRAQVAGAFRDAWMENNTRKFYSSHTHTCAITISIKNKNFTPWMQTKPDHENLLET